MGEYELPPEHHIQAASQSVCRCHGGDGQASRLYSTTGTRPRSMTVGLPCTITRGFVPSVCLVAGLTPDRSELMGPASRKPTALFFFSLSCQKRFINKKRLFVKRMFVLSSTPRSVKSFCPVLGPAPRPQSPGPERGKASLGGGPGRRSGARGKKSPE